MLYSERLKFWSKYFILIEVPLLATWNLIGNYISSNKGTHIPKTSFYDFLL